MTSGYSAGVTAGGLEGHVGATVRDGWRTGLRVSGWRGWSAVIEEMNLS